MDRSAVLAAYDRQIRRHPEVEGPGTAVERDDAVVRAVAADGWAGVTWSGLDAASADDVIAAQIRFLAPRRAPWEWKHYSYDQPADLAERLVAAGFVAQPAETLLVAEIAGLGLDGPLPPGVEVTEVVDPAGVAALVAVHDQVFGGDHAAVGRALLAALGEPTGAVTALVARAGSTPVAAGRVQFYAGTEFAGLWGGATTPAWRGRGLFRALVARRAALASARGFRYLQVDASADSRPILRRLGFAELATTTPFVHPATADPAGATGGGPGVDAP